MSPWSRMLELYMTPKQNSRSLFSFTLVMAMLIGFVLISCVTIDDDAIDITNTIFTERSADCATYAEDYGASVLDIQNSANFNADVEITSDSNFCYFTSDAIPNHDFNDSSADFGGEVAEQDITHTIARNPSFAASVTYMTQETKNGIMLNGVRLDIISAGCYDPTNPDADGNGNVTIGCQSNDPWLLDPLSTDHKFGADLHNAHTQPGGMYHYHGNPKAMFDDNPGSNGSPVIGFAADGFPIYGSYFLDSDTGQVRKATSSYQLKDGARVAIDGVNPGGDYSGIYNDDWEYVAGLGDLDECNGMTVDGQYGYYAIDSYPWVIKCYKGTPHESFTQTGGGGGPNGGPPPGM